MPAHSLQYAAAQSVAISGIAGVLIRSAVALDRKNIVLAVGQAHSHINVGDGRSYLGVYVISLAA